MAGSAALILVVILLVVGVGAAFLFMGSSNAPTASFVPDFELNYQQYNNVNDFKSKANKQSKNKWKRTGDKWNKFKDVADRLITVKASKSMKQFSFKFSDGTITSEFDRDLGAWMNSNGTVWAVDPYDEDTLFKDETLRIDSDGNVLA